TAVAVLLVARTIGSTAAALWLGQSRDVAKAQLKRVERAEAQKTEQPWEAERARARACRFSHRVGQRFDSSAAVRRPAGRGVVTLSDGGARWSGFSPDGRTGMLHRWQGDCIAFVETVELASGRRGRRLRLDLAPGRRFRQGYLWASPDGRQAEVVEARAVYL